MGCDKIGLNLVLSFIKLLYEVYPTSADPIFSFCALQRRTGNCGTFYEKLFRGFHFFLTMQDTGLPISGTILTILKQQSNTKMSGGDLRSRSLTTTLRASPTLSQVNISHWLKGVTIYNISKILHVSSFFNFRWKDVQFQRMYWTVPHKDVSKWSWDSKSLQTLK